MSQQPNNNFNLVVPITGYTIRKSADGVEKYVLTGMASNTNIDLHGERMAKSAIEAMEKGLSENTVTINNEHSQDWDADFGEVTKFWSTDNYELMMEAELDPDHYRTKTLIKALNKGKKLGLSIGGTVKDAAQEFVEEIGRKVLTYKDISLFHVAITGTPAVADTWVAPITKSMKDWKETPMSVQTTKAEETTVETPETDVSAAETTVEQASNEATAPEEAAVETPAEEANNADVPAEADEDAQEENPTAEVEEQASAEGEEPEATEEDTTTKSDSEEAENSSEENTDPETETTPADPEAPEQKDEAPASDDSAPAPAEEGTSEVEKSAIFGGYASAEVAQVSVRVLTEELGWAVWGAVYSYDDAEDERKPEERKAFVAQALKEYSAIVQSVADALIDNGLTGDADEAQKQFVAPRAEEVAKSITALDERVASLQKSLSDKDEEIAKVSKSLLDKTTELEEVREELASKAGELETTTTELEGVSKELQTIKGRKAIVFDKFTGAESTTKSAVSSPSPTLNRWLNGGK